MSVRLENIDELIKRTNVGYEDAKEALENCNDDILEALIYLEKQNKIKSGAANQKEYSLWDKIKKLIKKGNETRFIIKKRDSIVLSMPVTAAVIITIIVPYIVGVALVIALITGHRLKFESKNTDTTKVNEVLSKVSDTVDTAKKKLVETENNETAGN